MTDIEASIEKFARAATLAALAMHDATKTNDCKAALVDALSASGMPDPDQLREGPNADTLSWAEKVLMLCKGARETLLMAQIAEAASTLAKNAKSVRSVASVQVSPPKATRQSPPRVEVDEHSAAFFAEIAKEAERVRQSLGATLSPKAADAHAKLKALVTSHGNVKRADAVEWLSILQNNGSC